MITPPRDDESLASASNRSSRTLPYTDLTRTAPVLGPNYDRHLSTDNSHSCVQLLHMHCFTFLVNSIDSDAFPSDANDYPDTATNRMLFKPYVASFTCTWIFANDSALHHFMAFHPELQVWSNSPAGPLSVVWVFVEQSIRLRCSI
jgi:hypothetical protein